MSFILNPFRPKLSVLQSGQTCLILGSRLSVRSPTFCFITTKRKHGSTLVGATTSPKASDYNSCIGELPNNVRTVYDHFRENELKWWLSVSKSHRRACNVDHLPQWYLATKNLSSVEVLATLMRFKPCTFFFSAEVPLSISDQMVQANVKPFYEELRLEDHGFVLQKVTNLRVIEDRGIYTNLSGAWVLADTQSDEWETIKELFFSPSTKYCFHHALTRPLGYPFLRPLLDPAAAKILFQYKDLGRTREVRRLMGNGAAPVCAHSYFTCVGAEEEAKARLHFKEFKELIASFNIELELVVKHLAAEKDATIMEEADEEQPSEDEVEEYVCCCGRVPMCRYV